MYKNIFEELAFKFSHLGDLKPDQVQTKFNIFGNLISENFVHNLNPSRYSFYMEFMKGLTDPDLLKSIIYETKLIQKEKETETKLIDQIVSKINQLYNVNVTDEMIDNDVLYAAEKNKLIKNESERLTKRIKNIVNSDGIDMNPNQKKIDNIIDQTFNEVIIDDDKAGIPTAPSPIPSSTASPSAPPNEEKIVGGAGADAAHAACAARAVGGAGEDGTAVAQKREDLGSDVEDFIEGTDVQNGQYIGQIPPIESNGDQLFQDPTTVDQMQQFDMGQIGVDSSMGLMPTNQQALKNVTEIGRNIEDIRTKIKDKKIKKDELEKAQQDLEDYKKSLDELASENEKDTSIQEKLNGLYKAIENITKDIDDKLEEIRKKEENAAKVGQERQGAFDEFEKMTKEDDQKVKDITDSLKSEKEKMKTNLDMMRKDFYDKSLLNMYRNKLSKVLRSSSSDAKLKAQKLKDIIDDIENNDAISVNALKLSKEDRIIFIFITFIIRLITLSICSWGLLTNYLVSFTHAYILYVILYCIFVLIIVVLVNITFRYPVSDLYTGKHNLFTSIASVLYFFYLPPGAMMSHSIRLFLHFGIIIFLTMIAILIKSNQQNDEQLLNYNYTEKKKINRTLSNFSLLLWFFTSVVAMWC